MLNFGNFPATGGILNVKVTAPMARHFANFHDLGNGKSLKYKCSQHVKAILDLKLNNLRFDYLAVIIHSRTQSPSYAWSTERDKGLWPNPYQTGI
jgi:hypothetical protein